MCLSEDSSVLMDLHWPCSCTAQSSFLSIWTSICRSSVRHFPERTWTAVAFPCFSDQVFHELACPLSVVHPYTFFNLTTLFSYPVILCLSHAPLDVVVHFLVFLRSFGFESFLFQFLLLSHRSRIPAVTQFFSSSDDVCQEFHWLFQSLLCWRWWSLNPRLYLHCSWWWEVQTSRLS